MNSPAAADVRTAVIDASHPGAPDPYTADEFAELAADDMGAAHNASYRELAAECGMSPAEFQAFCEEDPEAFAAPASTDAMGSL